MTQDEPAASLFSARYSGGDWPVRYSGTALVSLSVKMHPTRNGMGHLLWGWTSYDYEGKHSAESATLYFCRKKVTGSGYGSVEELEAAMDVAASFPLYDIRESEIHEDWYSISGYESCYYAVIIHTESDGSYYYSWAYGDGRLSSVDFLAGGAPSVSYDNAKNSVTIGTSISGTRILEFEDLNDVSPTGITDAETLRNFLLSAYINLEAEGDYSAYSKYARSNRLKRFRPGSYSISMIDTQWDEFSSSVSLAIDSAIAEMNSVLSEFGISLFRNDGLGNGADITITYGNMDSLWGEAPGYSDAGYFHGGQWDAILDGYNIIGGQIEIAYEAHYYTTFSRIVFEELYQSFGCGYDQWEYPQNTTTNDDGGVWNPEYMTQKEADMLRLVYCSELSPGDDVTTASIVHNIPVGCRVLSGGTSDADRTLPLNFLRRGHTYRIRAWIVQSSGNMSATSDWITVTIPDRPPFWDWDASNGLATASQTRSAYTEVTNNGMLLNFSYLVWNDLVDKIYDTAGGYWSDMYATYSGTKMTSGDRVLTAARFNAARQNIGSHVSTGINEVSTGDIVYGHYFTTLTDKLNQWISQL